MVRVKRRLNLLSHFSFDMESMTWTELKPMNMLRWKARATVLDGHIYITGGSYDRDHKYCYNVIEIYDPGSDEWHQSLQPHSHNTEILFKWNSVLHSIGAEICRHASIVETYDASEKCWTKVRYSFPADILGYFHYR